MGRRIVIAFLAIVIVVANAACVESSSTDGGASRFAPRLEQDARADWVFIGGKWSIGKGLIKQTLPYRQAAAILRNPAFGDFTFRSRFKVLPVGRGVRAAAFIVRATGTLTYYWIHVDTRNGNVILVRSTPKKRWIELGRVHFPVSQNVWHAIAIDCRGSRISVSIDGKHVIERKDSTIRAGRVGVGTSQGVVLFKQLSIEGETVKMEQLKSENPPYIVISRGEAAGTYQAFPDVCRLKNGDLLCVFYAGYGHVSLPTPEWPKGGRICMVRSSDEGRTWSEPQILYDDEDDNRDPHIAQLSDGTLICSFFSLRPKEDDKGWKLIGVQMVRSTDGGRTWEKKARLILQGWACSAPVREMPNGLLIQGVYRQEGPYAWGGVIRSTDMGKTWSAPIAIGKDAKLPLDAETDVILLKDGTLYAALRSSKIHMHYATSKDFGLTWSAVKDIGFSGHAPHFTRLSDGTILLSHRLPNTALHISRDECKTWEGPYVIDNVIGAYPSTVELKDGTVLMVYYEEGQYSAVRAVRFRVKEKGIELLPLR